MKKLIGKYYLGDGKVNVFFRPELGGEFRFFPDDGDLGEIVIGMDYNHWYEVVAVLIHECQEFIMCQRRLRYRKDRDVEDQAAYVFIFNHQDYTQICLDIADFLVNILPDMNTKWKKWRKKK